MPNTQEVVLVTGGAGFIGTHVVKTLLDAGYAVRILDCLHPQIHAGPHLPGWIKLRGVDFIVGDVCDRQIVRKALRDVSLVIHLAARVGVGQSMYEPAEYFQANSLGTAVLMQEAALSGTQGRQKIRRILVASSMSVYGEGAYLDGTESRFTSTTPLSGNSCTTIATSRVPIPTPETAPLQPTSVYALTKLDQERTTLLLGAASGIEVLALRLFNVYGEGQSLSNPYTGVLAIFASQLLSGRRPRIYEDGCQLRDFVHVSDVAQAFRLTLEAGSVTSGVYNVGSGEARTVKSVAEDLGIVLGCSLTPFLTGQHRKGDVRHCFADIGAIRRDFEFEPKVSWTDGLTNLGRWLGSAQVQDDSVKADNELFARGLLS